MDFKVNVDAEDVPALSMIHAGLTWAAQGGTVPFIEIGGKRYVITDLHLRADAKAHPTDADKDKSTAALVAKLEEAP